MRGNTLRKGVSGAIVAASFSAWVGAPAARANFEVFAYNMSVQSYGGNDWQVWVLAASNDGVNGTGTDLAAADITIQTGGPSTYNSSIGAMAIDIERDSGFGTNTKYSVNIDGGTIDSNGANADANGQPSPPAFGDVVGGTFVGIAVDENNGPGFAAPFNTDILNYPIVTFAGYNPFSGLGVAADFANGHAAIYMGTLGKLDPAFENSGGVHAGNINNGTVHLLKLAVTAGRDIDPMPTPTNDGPVPFANIVVPPGTVFTVTGTLGGETGPGFAIPTIVLPEPASGATLALGAGFLLRRRNRSRAN